MSHLERQVRATQRRLWLDRWLSAITWCLGATGAAFAILVLVQRLWDHPWPIWPIGAGMLFAAVFTSIIWTVVCRESAEVAAAKLDAAAGLRERISSGRYCASAEDPFAQAVVADAERIATSISPRQHIKLTVPRPLGATMCTLVIAALMFLIRPGLLKKDQTAVATPVQVEATKVAIKKTMDQVKQMVETNPALEDLKDELGDKDKEPTPKLEKPEDLRHNSIKQIDNLADAIKQKREDEKYDAANELRKMLRPLESPKEPNAQTENLTKALSQGDFKAAKEELNQLKEQLATMKHEEDKQMVENLSKQLDDISKQIEKLAENKQLQQQLEQAGIKKEDVERMLENLKKEDLEQMKKQLEEKGMSQQQIQKLAEQMKKQQQAGSLAKKLSQQMQQASKCNNPSQMGEAMSGMSQAAEQLSQMEQLEQEAQQLDSAMAQLQDQKDNLDQKPCSKCSGSGQKDGKPCSKCKGGGKEGGSGKGDGDGDGDGKSGMGEKPGQGEGGIAQKQSTDVGFTTERAKVHTGDGAIIGQVLFEGEQVKGEVNSKVSQVFTAAERDASDLVNRDRIPRQYQKAVREYFSNVQKTMKKPNSDKAAPKTEASEEKDAKPSEENEPKTP